MGRDPYSNSNSLYSPYIYVHNVPLFYADRLGLLTIGIDGTNYDNQRNNGQKSSVSAILNMVNDSTFYQGGPGSDYDMFDWFTDATGSSLFFWEYANNSFAEIRDSVHQKICSEYYNNRKLRINIFGWSRGAVIAVEVAKLLKEKGCCTRYSNQMARNWNPFTDKQFDKKCCKWEKPIPVNFIGLFDPVDMSFFNINTSSKPDNVNTIFSIQSDSRAGIEQVLFPPQKYDGEERVKLKRNHDGTRTKHGDIGGTENSRMNDVLDVMKKKASGAGVVFK